MERRTFAKSRLHWFPAVLATTACTPTFRTQDDEGRAGAGAQETGGRFGTGGGSEADGGRTAGGDGPSSSAAAGTGVAGTGEPSGGRSSGHAGAPGNAGTQNGGGPSGPTAGSTSTGGDGGIGGAPQAGQSSGGAGQSSGGRSGQAGTQNLGGLAGTGGSAGATAFCRPDLVVDDMEDGDALTCANQGRSGDWWTATGTPTGSIDPPTNEDFPAFALGTDARPGSNYGMRLSGTGFGHTDDDWASLGFFLAGNSPYDLTPYSGMSFYAKSRTLATQVHVEFATLTTTPTSDGGTCDSDCTDHYGGSVTVDTSWNQFTIDFSAVKQEGWGPKPKDLAHTIFVYFGYAGTDGGPTSFDFLVDDVRLY